MIEKDPRAVAILKENVGLLGLADRAEVVRGDALRRDLWMPALPDASSGASPGASSDVSSGVSPEAGPDLVFLDPPYALIESGDTRNGILERAADLLRRFVRPGGCIVLHVPARGVEALAVPGPWRRDARRYGNSGLLYLFRPEPGKSEGRA
jgi:16S rRNA G966 N2-methylase RsmD